MNEWVLEANVTEGSLENKTYRLRENIAQAEGKQMTPNILHAQTDDAKPMPEFSSSMDSSSRLPPVIEPEF